MKITLGRHEVNVCSAPAFMGHEEIVLPMLVRGRKGRRGGLGEFSHVGLPYPHQDDAFELNDLASTAIGGVMSGCDPHNLEKQRRFPDTDSGHRLRVTVERIFVDGSDVEWNSVPAIEEALEELGRSYAFFLETSADPFHDAYIARCRFICRERLAQAYLDLDCCGETEQTAAAKEVLAAFFFEHCREPDCRALYGGCQLFDIYRGDADQFMAGSAIWLEQKGVVRAWTRIGYSPK